MRVVVSAFTLALVLSLPTANAAFVQGDIWHNPLLGETPTFNNAPTIPNITGPAVATLNAPLTGFWQGTQESWVYPNSSGGLTFAYRTTITGADTNDEFFVERLSYNGAWDGLSISDAGSDQSGSTVSRALPGGSWTNGDAATLSYPASNLLAADMTHTTDAGLLGGTGLGWNGGPTTSTALFWFETNATLWGQDLVVLQDGRQGQGAILTPMIPEPASLLLIALGGLALRRR